MKNTIIKCEYTQYEVQSLSVSRGVGVVAQKVFTGETMKTVQVVGPHRLCQWWSWYGCVKGRWGLLIQGKGEGRLGRWLGKHHEVRFCIYFNFLVIVIANENFQVLGPRALDFFATSQFAAFEKQGALTGTKVLRQEDIGATQPCPAILLFFSKYLRSSQ